MFWEIRRVEIDLELGTFFASKVTLKIRIFLILVAKYL